MRLQIPHHTRALGTSLQARGTVEVKHRTNLTCHYSSARDRDACVVVLGTCGNVVVAVPPRYRGIGIHAFLEHSPAANHRVQSRASSMKTGQIVSRINEGVVYIMSEPREGLAGQ